MSAFSDEIARAAKDFAGGIGPIRPIGPIGQKDRLDLRRCGGCKKKMLKEMKEDAPVSQSPKSQAPSPLLRIAAVITVFNEGEEVRKTVESLKASVRDTPSPQPSPDGRGKGEGIELLVIVVDDGSTDGSCDGLATDDIVVVRHDQPWGVGRSRNDGLAAALEARADVFTFHDGHMRFPAGVIEALARKAIESGAIVTSKARGWWDPDGTEHSFRAWGADLHFNAAYGLQPKYRIYRSDKSDASDQSVWDRVPCPMGACYVFSRKTIEALSAPTGRLWDDVAGRWGFSEQALAVKAFLLDIPVLVSRDLATHHHYRGTNPVPNAGVETWKNVCFAMASLLSERTFEERFRAYCEARLGPKEVKSLVAKARVGRVGLVGRIGPVGHGLEQEIFSHLCGRGATIERVHEDHVWLDALLSFAPSPTPQAPRLRVLQWRPGESTLHLLSLFPDAQITCLEWNDHRFQNWMPILKPYRNVRLVHTTLENWADQTRTGFIKPDARFDLITIGGELQENCRAAAERLLAPGGQIVVNPTGDRLQIADEYRHEAEKKLKEFKVQGSRVKGTPAAEGKVIDLSRTSPTGQPRPTLTVCLLNWKRPENIGPLLDCLARQTLKLRVVLWDNSEADMGTALHWRSGDGELKPITTHPLVERVVKASANMGCFPRWWMAADCDTDYVCSLDDDLVFADDRVLEDAVAAQREECPDGIVGFFGWSRVPGRSYKDSRHHNGTTTGTRCDVIKGRFMLLKRDLLERVPILVPGATLREDDIYLSLCISGGKKDAHCIPARLGKRWKELPQRGASASGQAGHYELRETQIEALLNYFAPKGASA